MSRFFQVPCFHRVGAVGLLVAVTLAMSLKACGIAAENPRQSLQLDLEARTEPVRPGEFVTIPFVITNVLSRQVLLAVNQGDDGAHYAAKTLSTQLTNVLAGKPLRTFPFCGCPVGEGFDKLLGALAQCKYRTNDTEVLAYMLDAVRSANPDRFASSTASYVIDACAALGVENTRPILEEIGRRLSEVRDDGGRLRQRLNEVLVGK